MIKKYPNYKRFKDERPKIKTKQNNDVYKHIGDLKPGDVLYGFLLFEENTPEYYNGHKPKSIRGEFYQNRRGQEGKKRPFLFMGFDDDNLMYLPITSSSGAKDDSIHQYELKDNTMIDKNGRFPHSYIEIDSLRPFPLGNKDSFKYLGTINDDDYQNIIHRVTHSTIQFDGYRDHRGIVPESDELKIKDYKLTDHDKSCNQLIVFLNCLN